ncbi:hypothetical protein [Paenibacillus anseongense]|uniref:hypothetical protein n=1 Tax=Paenibacillus anseongense TaxID=2682845 RepID=UPI002DBB55E9|nr:hypothetical protein [Paenibacillus anseongense]MEC0265127.1 hypothetical protein [Paenibacillus anseongense]
MSFANSRRRGFATNNQNAQSDPYSTDKLDTQISNANTRIADAGYKTEDADQRNWFEKATNLPQGQNWLFDTLELLGRPGGAIKNVIDKSLLKDSESVGKAAWKGFSGKEKVHGSDIAEDLGVDNKLGKFALGLGLDIGLDPLTYVPGGVLLKGAKGVGSLAAAPVKYGYKALESTSPALQTLRSNVIEPALTKGKDVLGHAFVPQYKWDQTLTGGSDDTLKNLFNQTNNNIRFQSEESLNNIGNVAKSTGIKAGDDVGRLMEAPLRQFEDVKGYEFPDGIRRTENKDDLVSELQKNRDLLKDSGKAIGQNNRDYTTAIRQTSEELQKVDSKIRQLYFSKENEALRQLTKKKNQPLNIDELAQSKAFSKVSISPSFNYLINRRDELKNGLNDLRTEAETIKSSGNQKLKNIADESSALKESLRNPVQFQKEIARPVRELSTDPKVQQAAEQLIKSNDNIRQWATDSGVDVGELQGYMAHILSAEERAARLKKVNVDQGVQGNQPDKKILNARTLKGSVEDVNDQLGRKFFEPNAYFSTAIGQKRLIQYANAVKFRRDVLSNKDFAQPFVKGMQVADDSVVINTNNYKFIKDPLGQLPDEVGGEYLVTKGVKEALDRYQKAASDEGTKGFLKAYDTLQSLWKRGALFSLGYHARNQAGAMFNNYVGGMNPADLVKYTKDGFKEVTNAVKGKESQLFTEYRQQGLSSSALSHVEFAKFGEEPEKAIERTINNMSRDTKGQVIQRLNPKNAFNTSQEIGNYFDQANRFGLYKWARDKGMSSEDAAKKVREVQFDYSNTTPFESNVMSRVIPFYRWMRNNIPFQIRQAINDPRKYEYVNKARENAQDVVGLNDENIPAYMKENFSIPIVGDHGKGQMLGLNLPLGDVTKLSKPGKTLVDSVSAVLKTPAELALNYNTFRGKPIQKFEGQEKKYEIPFTNKEFGIPEKLAYALEQLTGQVGRGLSGFMQKPEDVDQDTLNRLPSLGVSSLTKDFDAEQYAYYKRLDDLKKLQDLMLYIQQQEGAKPRTLAEIKKSK